MTRPSDRSSGSHDTDQVGEGSQPGAPEAAIRAACDAGDYGAAVTLLWRAFSDELLWFLMAELRDQSAAEEVFAILAEGLWLGLPKFEFRSKVRTWAYTVARHVAVRYATAPQHRRARNLTLSGHVQLSQLVEQTRSRTRAYLRTEMKDRVRELRERLEPHDRTLLFLRIDRRLSWRDLAVVMRDDNDGAPSDGELDREAARLRKRFERVKAELKALAKAEGLL